MQEGFQHWGTHISKIHAPTCAINTTSRSQPTTAEPTPLAGERAHRTHITSTSLLELHLMIHKVELCSYRLHRPPPLCRNGAVSSAGSGVLICESSWSLTIENHWLPSKRKAHPPSCNANRQNWGLRASTQCSSSVELSTQNMKKLIFVCRWSTAV